MRIERSDYHDIIQNKFEILNSNFQLESFKLSAINSKSVSF